MLKGNLAAPEVHKTILGNKQRVLYKLHELYIEGPQFLDSPVDCRAPIHFHLVRYPVGMMLRGMGFANNTPIYLASGKIYKSERNLTKKSLATPEVLASFEHSNS
ncbi:hypothetical protein CsSME_00034900 [Camellia sinensis var. sinensis]